MSLTRDRDRDRDRGSKKIRNEHIGKVYYAYACKGKGGIRSGKEYGGGVWRGTAGEEKGDGGDVHA